MTTQARMPNLAVGVPARPLAILAAIVAIGVAGPAAAQQRYRPSRPTVSPYLNLLRTNNSPVPNYYTFVRPSQTQSLVNRQQQQAIEQQTVLLNQLQNNQAQLQRDAPRIALGPETGSSAWFRRASAKSAFRNTGRYFQRAGRR